MEDNAILKQPLISRPYSRSTSLARHAQTSVDSLSYNLPTNTLRLAEHTGRLRRRLLGFSGHTAVANLSTILTGVLIGVTAFGVQQSIEHLADLRNTALQQFFLLDVGQAVGVWAGLSLLFVTFAGALVHLFAPKAAGAGVPPVMAFLNGVDIPGLLSFPVLVLKIFGLVCVRVANLAVGPEGPMVHIGACIASLLSSWEPWLLNRALKRDTAARLAAAAAAAGRPGASADEVKEPPPSVFKNTNNRDLVAAGAAAGIAAAFGAPIGGVLFALEEAATHWSRTVGWRCFACTVCAAFTLYQLHPRSQSGMISFQADSPLSNQEWLAQTPFVVLVSACGGLLGTAFNVMRKALWRVRASRKRPLLRLVEAAGVALVTVLVMAGLSLTVGRCLPVPEAWEEGEAFRLTCPEGQYNDMATAFLSSDSFVIRTLLDMGSEAMPIAETCLLSPCYFSWQALVAMCGSFLVLMALACSLCVPGGTFMPSIMIGASFGALYGLVLKWLLPSWHIQPGVYALICATAVLGGVFRSGMALVVIVIEGTRGINFMFGIIMAVLTSNYVSSLVLHYGVYESELERDGKNVYYLHPEPPHELGSKTAADIMATPVVGLETVAPVAAVRQLLRATTHNGFPVYGSSKLRDRTTGMGRLSGFILRSQLEVLLSHRAFCDAEGRYLIPPADVAAYEAQLDLEMRQALATAAMQAGQQPQGPPGGNGPALGASGRFEYDAEPKSSGGLAGAGSYGLLGGAGSGAAAEDLDLGSGGFAMLDSAEQRLDESLPPGEPAPAPAPAPTPGLRITVEKAARAAGLETGALTPRGVGYAAAVLEAVCGSGAEGGAYLNLRPFMDRAPFTVQQECLGTDAHRLFLALALRHLVVLDARHYVAGIITRKDLDHAAGEGAWRINAIAPDPHHNPKRHQRWLAISLAAPRRLLSSIGAALSPLASPMLSRRGTPSGTPRRGSPAATPKRGSPTGTPRAASDAPAGFAAGNVGHSPFWQAPAAWEAQAAAAQGSGAGVALMSRSPPEELTVSVSMAGWIRGTSSRALGGAPSPRGQQQQAGPEAEAGSGSGSGQRPFLPPLPPGSFAIGGGGSRPHAAAGAEGAEQQAASPPAEAGGTAARKGRLAKKPPPSARSSFAFGRQAPISLTELQEDEEYDSPY